MISLFTTLLNVLMTSLLIFNESRMYEQPILEYVLSCVQARRGWFPFMQTIKDMSLQFNLDFFNTKCPIPLQTEALGIQKIPRYQFNDQTLLKLRTYLEPWKHKEVPQRKISVYLNDESLMYVSFNAFLHFYEATIALKSINVIVDIQDWKRLIENADQNNLKF